MKSADDRPRGTRVVKALTVQQPWAECIARGAKRVENRTRPVSYRGPLAIHAGRTWSLHGGHNELVIQQLTGSAAGAPITEREATRHLGVTTGAVIAITELVDCHPARGCCRPWGEPDAFHLVLANAQRLPKPIPARGYLGLWRIDIPPHQSASSSTTASTCPRGGAA